MTNKRLCFLTRNYRTLDSAGNKAKTDNEDTLRRIGAVNLGIRRTYYNNKVTTFFLDLIGVVSFCLRVRRGDRVLLQYPVKKYFAFLCRVTHLRGARVMALIHDLGSFRRKRLTVPQEIRRLMHADYVIASNGEMRSWLLAHGYRHPLGALQLFDYLSSALPAQTERPHQAGSPFGITYAGSLNRRKNSFFLKLKDMDTHYVLHIYGRHDGLPGLESAANFVFHGFTPSDTFIRSAEGDFGLVWDGDSVDSCTGNFGEYLRFNSPHKVSFYLRAGLPIIVWRQAAVADIVEREGVGLCIDSLSELNSLLASVSNEQLQTMQQNVRRVADKLRSGGFLQAALAEVSF